MKVKLARTAGFCMGVHRAMDIVLTEANKRKGTIYTFGPLIHNRQVIDLLESKGVVTLRGLAEIEGKRGTLIVRAHGISPMERRVIKDHGLKIIDATCPKVAKVQSIIRAHTRKGYTAVIVGDKDHPEVVGLMGYGNGRALLINGPEDVQRLPEAERVFLVAQTTQDTVMYGEICEAVKRRYPDATIFDTICDATHSRQGEVRSFAETVDGMVVVGGYHSGNTKRLAQVSISEGIRTLHVETAEELDKKALETMETIGVTAGASTPNWIIKRVVQEIEGIQGRKDFILTKGVKRVIKLIKDVNLLVAFGGFCLAYAVYILLGREPDIIRPSLAFFYIYAMHVLNRFLDKGASFYNDPSMANFYMSHRRGLMLSGLVSMAAALGIALYLGIYVFLLVSSICVLGISYSLPIIPKRVRHFWRYSKIKDVPGSKTLSEALGWAVVIAAVPVVESRAPELVPAFFAFLFVLTVVYIRAAFFDIFQAQGDLIVGVETLPIILGEEKTLLLLKAIILFGSCVLFAGPLTGAVSFLAWLLIIVYASLLLCIITYQKNWIFAGERLELMVEGNLFLAGVLGYVWHAAG